MSAAKCITPANEPPANSSSSLLLIRDFSFDKSRACGQHGGPAMAEVVIHRDGVPALQQELGHGSPDIARAASN